MSEPAARISDIILCRAHGNQGPVFYPGADEVYIGGCDAARYTDLAMCNSSHVSPLAEGAAMVLINGLPAARLGHTTLDGAILITGEASVLIGGETFSPPDFISIHGDAGFQAKVLKDLYLISCTPSGKKLFASLAATGHKVDIQLGTKEDNNSYRGLTTSVPPRLNPPPGDDEPNDPRAYDGTGIDSLVKYNPDMDTQGYPEWGRPPNYSPDVTLFHELTHADGMAHGEMDRNWYPNPPSIIRPRAKGGERRAMGLSPYDDESKYPFSENSYRRDRGYMTSPVY
jgi:uncharacterized Zn-binding protein involved in type VI secretion